MGIKFRCPNGHKLNVKSFLAGKRGVCPKCGTSVRIPQQSPETSREEPGDEPEEQDDLLDEARFPAPGRAAATANGNAAVAAKSAAPMATPVTARPVVTAAPAAIPVVAAPVADPIAEAPAAIWYVRPPGGDQYGPARGDIMRRWIGEGRVSKDSLVWREGWTDWRPAAEVFGSLPSAVPQPPPAPAGAASAMAAPATAGSGAKDESPAPIPRSTRLTNRYEARKKSGSGLGIAAIVFLGLLCVVLAVLLVYFLGGFHNGSTQPPPATNAETKGGGN
jgi:hypothetical protein